MGKHVVSLVDISSVESTISSKNSKNRATTDNVTSEDNLAIRLE